MVEISKTLAIGAGCYWGTEKYIVKDFQKRFPGAIESASVGFMSPNDDAKANPSYREVCTGTTGHVEVLNVVLSDPEKTFEELIKFTFMFHDPYVSDLSVLDRVSMSSNFFQNFNFSLGPPKIDKEMMRG